ncbi:MAG TPA: prepilin peptidase [Anaeromyxobacteraceae bacterium]|nr:prepilin peptidase [Anaeromyxobacteraceae bacterium]
MDQAALDALRPYFVAWSALLGATVGSFLNVVIARLPAGLSVVRPRSRCPRCEAPIAWYDNVPVLSWLLLRARCRSCGAPISARYPLVELLVAALAAAAAWRHGPSLAWAGEVAFLALLVALAFIDLDTWLLPWALTIPLAALGLLLGAARATPAGGLGAAAIGGAAGFTFFLAVHLVGEKVFRREALGFGDVVLLGAIGAWLGPLGLLPVILLSSLQGAAVGIALLLAGRGEPGPVEEGENQHPNPHPHPHPNPNPNPSSVAVPVAPAPTPTAGESPLTPARSPEGGEGAVAQGSPEGGEGEVTAGGEGGRADDEDDWVPPRHAIPYGPFLALAAAEWLLLGPLLARAVPALSVFLR